METINTYHHNSPPLPPPPPPPLPPTPLPSIHYLDASLLLLELVFSFLRLNTGGKLQIWVSSIHAGTSVWKGVVLKKAGLFRKILVKKIFSDMMNSH